MAIDTKKISLPKTADNVKVQTVGDKLIAIYENAEGEMVQKTLPGNVNKDEEEMIKVGDKTYKVTDGKVTEVKQKQGAIVAAKPFQRGKQKSKANPGDAGGSTSKKETKRSIGPAGASIVSDDGKRIKTANLAKGGFPDLSGDGEVTQKDILMGKGVIKMKKGGIVKKKSSRTRIAKKGFGIAKRGY